MDPSQALAALLQPAGGATAFPPNSRYAGVGTATMTLAGADAPVRPDAGFAAIKADPAAAAEQIVYLRRRFIAPPERFALVRRHTVVQGDRPDNLAAHYLGDPILWWRLCDANNVRLPEELTAAPGKMIRITLPEGAAAAATGGRRA